MAIKSLTIENSAELVCDRIDQGRAGARFLTGLVGHLHALVRETRPSRDDWKSAIALLTEIGHAADDRRQEWVLASDLLGVSALVEEVNSSRAKGATPNTVRGPFYRSDAPTRGLGDTLSLDGRGERLEVRGRIVDLDRAAIAGATIETWQANGDGLYENQHPDLQPEFNLRGRFTADADGRFHYSTVRPGGYSPPLDGPVGRLLTGLNFPMRRPAHLHFIIRAEGFEPICTHVFDGSDPALALDALYAVRPELVGDFNRSGDSSTLDFTFVMARAKQERRAA